MIDFLFKHWVEIVAAIIFAALFGLIFWLYDPKLRVFADNFLSWTNKKLFKSSEKVFQENEIQNSITTNLDELEITSLVFDIKRHGALINSNKHHYEIQGDFHMERRFKLLSLLDGASSFFGDACSKMAVSLNGPDLNLVLFLENKTNEILATEICMNLPRRIKTRRFGYDETENYPINDWETESLQGQRVIIVDSLACSSEPLLSLIEFVQGQGGIVLKVAILFKELNTNIDFSMVGAVPVIIAYNIDLKLHTASKCERCKSGSKKTKSVLYKDYVK